MTKSKLVPEKWRLVSPAEDRVSCEKLISEFVPIYEIIQELHEPTPRSTFQPLFNNTLQLNWIELNLFRQDMEVRTVQLHVHKYNATEHLR